MDNGGATAQGVTKDKITVVAVIPNDEQKKSDPVAPKQRAGAAPSTYQNSLYDYLLPQMRFFETWGRDIEVKFIEASGNDEAAQRADLVAVKAMKPFAAIVYAQPPAGLPPLSVLEGGLAQAKILVMGYAATARRRARRSPIGGTRPRARRARSTAPRSSGSSSSARRRNTAATT